MSLLDWAIVLLYFVASAVVGVYYARRAGSNLEEFFLSGRDLPWWLAGTSMVATTFAADTPLAVTELVAKYGISGNWLWWYGSISSIVTVYFFAPLWKKSGVLTDIELVNLRYSGIGADILRIFKSIYLGFFMNVLILSWVNLAMLKV